MSFKPFLIFMLSHLFLFPLFAEESASTRGLARVPNTEQTRENPEENYRDVGDVPLCPPRYIADSYGNCIPESDDVPTLGENQHLIPPAAMKPFEDLAGQLEARVNSNNPTVSRPEAANGQVDYSNCNRFLEESPALDDLTINSRGKIFYAGSTGGTLEVSQRGAIRRCDGCGFYKETASRSSNSSGVPRTTDITKIGGTIGIHKKFGNREYSNTELKIHNGKCIPFKTSFKGTVDLSVPLCKEINEKIDTEKVAQCANMYENLLRDILRNHEVQVNGSVFVEAQRQIANCGEAEEKWGISHLYDMNFEQRPTGRQSGNPSSNSNGSISR